MSTKIAVTFGSKHQAEAGPARPWMRTDGYITVEGENYAQAQELAGLLCGSNGNVLLYAFDYKLEEFESRPETAHRYPRGVLARFTTLPVWQPTTLTAVPR